MIKRNMFIVARGNNAAYLSHDPATGKYKTDSYLDIDIETKNAKAYVASLSVLNEILNTIACNQTMMSSSRSTIYILDDIAIRYYEARKAIAAATQDKAAGTSDAELAIAQKAFIDAVEDRLVDRGFDPLTDEQITLMENLVCYAAATSHVVTIKKLTDLRTMTGSFANNMKKLASIAWDLVPQPELQEEGSAPAPVMQAIEEIPF